MTPTKWPALYEIRVESVLHERWSDWLEGLRVETEHDVTILSGTLSDLSALHGVLDKLRDLGLTVISVRRVRSGEDPTEKGER